MYGASTSADGWSKIRPGHPSPAARRSEGSEAHILRASDLPARHIEQPRRGTRSVMSAVKVKVTRCNHRGVDLGPRDQSRSSPPEGEGVTPTQSQKSSGSRSPDPGCRPLETVVPSTVAFDLAAFVQVKALKNDHPWHGGPLGDPPKVMYGSGLRRSATQRDFRSRYPQIPSEITFGYRPRHQSLTVRSARG